MKTKATLTGKMAGHEQAVQDVVQSPSLTIFHICPDKALKQPQLTLKMVLFRVDRLIGDLWKLELLHDHMTSLEIRTVKQILFQGLNRSEEKKKMQKLEIKAFSY